ncbi:hypothetical protein PGT21_012226 [Puccinia graminis f. sp. tritici]|uniref:Uncharacterized protein n=1 Tax=Puccinia graminis f. sp. tritici TaxID=56615 RepID=A0A5B0LS83_PUCGR|nr:hypothetical protein PGTUg99_027521 [Puccinia graminis f. sp. tritici]KAA1071552.1 hypothetical protein PGT21_011389 [Puccinia graminis f. sp. tritici]KAA1077573.1 hypothetical protein PGT21_012226 [Puccinia graminis f. sp. tritici]KAA1102822.1 hypothetical protein PGTUg99_036415 [Puccinia graminis f. sp. tritici]
MSQLMAIASISKVPLTTLHLQLHNVPAYSLDDNLRLVWSPMWCLHSVTTTYIEPIPIFHYRGLPTGISGGPRDAGMAKERVTVSGRLLYLDGFTIVPLLPRAETQNL